MKVCFRRLTLALVIMAFGAVLSAQNIPIGTWRTHISFYSLLDVLPAQTKVYATAPNGVLMLDRQDNSIRSYHKGNGLNNSGISRMAYDATTDQLLVAYTNGTFDAIRENRVRFFDPGKNAIITGSKAINDININGSVASFATDYGVLIYDLARSEIKETWRDLGKDGTTMRIFASTIRNNSVFLATESGVIAGNLADNLLDFSKWERFEESDLPGLASSIVSVGDVVYASFVDDGVFAYSSGAWAKVDGLPAGTFFNLTATADKLVLTNGTHVWVVNVNSNEASIVYTSSDIPIVKAALDDTNGLWIATDGNGLVTNETGSFAPVIPNGPAFNETVALCHQKGKLFAVSGGFTYAFQPSNKPGVISVFQEGTWISEILPASDLTSIAFSGERKFIGTFGFGVVDSEDGVNRIWDETNSSLININPPEKNITVTSVAAAADGLWVANYGAVPALHYLDYVSNSWESFSFPYANSRYPVKLRMDLSNNLWMVLNPESGGGLVVFNKDKNESIILSVQVGQGGLPSNRVYEVENDREGNIWVGTDAGVAYFFDKNNDAVKPLFENRFLLRDETVRAIAVDGGNRKWIGTDRGVWLFNPTGEEALANFTAENSPLPSNRIYDIEIDPVSGEVFFATDRGVASFRSNATGGNNRFESIKIFPNPVTSGFTGEVGISGLATDAVLKITDISGRLVRETRANGGSASWDVKDTKGKRVQTGIYLVMAVTPEGSESIVGKIAVVN
jgi:hypothetical protein